jgi:adhesin HecA-like repeat protein
MDVLGEPERTAFGLGILPSSFLSASKAAFSSASRFCLSGGSLDFQGGLLAAAAAAAASAAA